MRATLEFDLNDVDDKMAHLRCIKASDMALVLWEIQMNLNKKIEREIEISIDKELPLTPYDGKDLVLDAIRTLLNEHGLSDVSELIN